MDDDIASRVHPAVLQAFLTRWLSCPAARGAPAGTTDPALPPAGQSRVDAAPPPGFMCGSQHVISRCGVEEELHTIAVPV